MTDQPHEETIWLRTRDAAEVLGVTERTVRKRIAAGKLPAQRVNGSYLVRMPRDQVTAAGIELEPANPDRPDTGGPVVVQRPSERTGVDLAPLAEAVERLSEENARLAATAAMYQERARSLEERIAQLTTPALPGTASPPRPWWRRLFGD